MPGKRASDPSSHIGFLDEAETDAARKKRQKAEKADKDLDLDRIW